MIDKFLDFLSPSFVIEIYNSGKIVEYTYGYKSNNKEELVDSNTLYDIASLTKTFTSTLIYKAYEENLLDLNSTIYDIDSNFVNLNDIKVIDLITHNQNIWTNGYIGDSKDKEEFYKILYSSYVKDYNRTYVDMHYIILSTILEKIYNKPFNELCEEKIFNILNLKDTTFNPDPNRCASCNYEHINDKVISNIYPGITHDTKARIAKEFGIYTGHAGIFTTGKDLLTFLSSFFNYSILKKETIELMLKHDDLNLINYNILKDITNGTDINTMYNEIINTDSKNKICKTYNYFGTRYKNDIDVLNDVPYNASNNTVSFSGYTGPMFTIDFDKKIIIVIMSNVVNNNTLSREERKRSMFELMDIIYNSIK